MIPLILIVLGFPPFGWAKPTPVDTRNFKNVVKDDILTALAGPVSNLLTAFLSPSSPWRSSCAVRRRRHAIPLIGKPTIASPLATCSMSRSSINVILAVFNLIPLPPLDGSHVMRHFLSYNALQVYDRIGNWG